MRLFFHALIIGELLYAPHPVQQGGEPAVRQELGPHPGGGGHNAGGADGPVPAAVPEGLLHHGFCGDSQREAVPGAGEAPFRLFDELGIFDPVGTHRCDMDAVLPPLLPYSPS